MLSTNNGFYIKDSSNASSNGNEGADQWWRTREYTTNAAEQPKLTIVL